MVPMLRKLGDVRRRAPVVFHALACLLAVEVAAVVAAPVLVPTPVYLKLYLGRDVRRTTMRFLAGHHRMLEFDPLLGWRNRPNVEHGHWKTDSLGSRSTHPVGLRRSKPTRVLFLGSSAVNGGTAVTASETVSAYVEDSTTEAVNMGTMMYSLGQVYLAYASSLHRYDANVVVVGLQDDPAEGLANRYVPYCQPSEVNVPFLRPRFEMTDTGPALAPVPSRDVYARMVESGAIVDTLRTTDDCHYRFAGFRRFGLTPIAGATWYLYRRARNLVRHALGPDAHLPLALAIMRRLEAEAHRHGARVVFVLLPGRTQTYPPLWRRWLPDHHGRVVAAIRAQGSTLLDGRNLLRRAGKSPREVYDRDGVEYVAEGNRLIGEALHRVVRSKVMAEGGSGS